MRVYHYHEITRQYLGSSEAQPDPMEPGNWLIPAWATPVEPPAEVEEGVLYFDGLRWSYRDA